ncbi:MAG TPA: FecR domain-containing protein [Chitinophaga sp.]|uniref:FecR family protein n=1 Tax=Chitinophaga sp. TaxID=1869181 RepID=UPI002BC20D28|nr:FecR domain-containing protein [Chitinophaga sp.]HVI44201.1 FecR domain-containing protein [Chitinophaga sp.]
MKEQHSITDYLRYDTNDFLTDEYFQEWVKYEKPDANAFWNEFLRQYPQKEQEVQEAYDLLRRLRFTANPPSPERTRRMWDYIEANTPKQPAARRINLPSKWLLAAASIILIITLGIWQWSRERYTYVTSINSEISHIILPDNSEVTLNANSRLKYARDFGAHNNRELWVQGEAFFSVAPHTGADGQRQSFTVHTNELSVKVTGTAFNVYARHGESRVVLNHGGVTIHFNGGQQPDKILHPGDMLEYNSSQNPVVQKVDTLLFTSWKQKRFLFADTPLKEVARMMEDFYGCRVVFKDTSLTSRRITADMNIPDIDVMETVLSSTLNIDIQKDGNTLILQKKP